MNRKIFLTFAALIALSVGLFAVVAPSLLLENKGVVVTAATMIWVREVGVFLIALGVMSAFIRNHNDSPTMKAILFSNMLIQIGLFPLEIAGYFSGTISKISGILPNSALHLLLAIGFGYYSFNIKLEKNEH